MKKKIYLIILITLFVGAAATTHAATITADSASKTQTSINSMTDAQKEARLDEIQQRMVEIIATDKSNLTKEQRKALRVEVRGLKAEVKHYMADDVEKKDTTDHDLLWAAICVGGALLIGVITCLIIGVNPFQAIF
jgi:CHASE3 domain sensor protein